MEKTCGIEERYKAKVCAENDGKILAYSGAR